MAVEVFMPRLTHEMASGRLVEWLVDDGASVRKGEPLFAVETDKATVDVEAEASGVLRGRQFQPGDDVPVGALMAWISSAAEQAAPEAQEASSERTALDQGAPTAQPAPVAAAPQSRPPSVPSPLTAETAAGAATPGAAGRIVASPLAKRLARELDIDLRLVSGRGPHGRITQADVQAFAEPRTRLHVAEALAAAASEPRETGAAYETAPLSRLKQTVGERMSASWRSTPHFDLEVEVDMGEAARWRKSLVASAGSDVSYTALLVFAVARTLRRHPRINAAFAEGQLRVYREINMGVAMATPQGLMVPVIPRADELILGQIQEALTLLRQKAESLRFSAEDVASGTFTLSNLGMYGIDAFRAIINPPQAAILTVGRIAERPLGKDGQVVLRPTARLVLSVDHRVLDGAEAAPFLSEVRNVLENPYLLL